MEILYIVGIEFIFIILLMEVLPLEIAAIISIFFIILAGVLLKERSLFFYIIPVIFLFRVETTIFNNTALNYGDKIDVKVKIYQGIGEILEINSGYPLKKCKIKTNKIIDGNYFIRGKIEKIYNKNFSDTYFLEVIKIENIKENIFRKYFGKLVENRTENMSYQEKNLYKSIIMGVRDGMHEKIKNLFLKNGLMHILAISGLHIGIILYGIKKIFSIFVLSKRVLNIYILLGITLYFLAIRVTPSVERAYIMSLIYLLGNIFYENAELKKSLAISFIISLLINPISYKEISFIMSYWAMFSIVIGEKLMGKGSRLIEIKIKESYIFLKKILNYLYFSIYIQMAMLPINLLIFENFNPFSIIFSIILTPVGIVYIFLSFVNLIVPISFLCSFIFKILVNTMEFFV